MSPARQEGGLFAHREAGAAAAPQARVFELLEDLVRPPSRGRPSPASRSRRSPGSPRGCASRGSSACSSRTRVSRHRPRCSRGRGVAGQRPPLQRLLRQHLVAAQQLLDRRRRLGRLQRPEVALIDRGHRRDVAGAEALKAGDEDVLLTLGRGAESVEQLVAAAHPAADVGADRDLVAADRLGVQEVVEAGDRLQVGRGDAHHRGGLANSLGGAPAVAPLHRPERRDRGRFAVRVAAHQRLDRARAAPAGSRLRAALGSPAGCGPGPAPSGRARCSRPGGSGSRCRRAVDRATTSPHRLTGQRPRGSGRACRGCRSCRRCSCRSPCRGRPAG